MKDVNESLYNLRHRLYFPEICNEMQMSHTRYTLLHSFSSPRLQSKRVTQIVGEQFVRSKRNCVFLGVGSTEVSNSNSNSDSKNIRSSRGSMRSSSTHIATCSYVRAVGTVSAPHMLCVTPVGTSLFFFFYIKKEKIWTLDSRICYKMWGFALETFEILTKCHKANKMLFADCGALLVRARLNGRHFLT